MCVLYQKITPCFIREITNSIYTLMNKKLGLFYCFALLVSLMTTSCNSNDDLVGNWVTASTDFSGSLRGYASSFVVGNDLYVFGGYDGSYCFSDLWKLDISDINGSWTQLASLTDTATVTDASTAFFQRKNAVAFAIGTNGYVGTGANDTYNMRDFWKYDTKTNKWTQIANFPGTARYGCYGFTLGSKGYVGGGYGYSTSTATSGKAYYSDMYSYDPTTDSWEQLTSQGHKRAFASVFVINNIAYIFGGLNSTGEPNDMWAFDGANWTPKENITNTSDASFDDDYTTIARYSASTFVINGKGYLTGGIKASTMKYTWEYDPTIDRWKEKTGFERTSRSGAISGATATGVGIVLTGNTGSKYLDDVEYFYPAADYNNND